MRPDAPLRYKQSRMLLGEVLVRKRDWAAVERTADELAQAGPNGEVEAESLLGRAKIERKDYSAARFGLRVATQKYPQSLRLWQLLAQSALAEGIDLREGEMALRRIVELDPADEQAQRNLNLLAAHFSKQAMHHTTGFANTPP